MTGDELDIFNLSAPCSRYHAYVNTQQPAPYYVQSMACSSQLPISKPGPAQSPVQSYQPTSKPGPVQSYQPYQYQPYNPYTAHCDQYTQQCNPQPQ